MADEDRIRVEGARQNNLKGLDLELPLHELIVVTGVSGSGKSSLAFDTIYSEGQRRYVETFSPYARQFLDRMDKPSADRIDGIPPAIAIDQTNPVRTSRSTVGTMTELNDHLKLLFARAARLHCRGCGAEVRRDTARGIIEAVLAGAAPDADGRPGAVAITFAVEVPESFTVDEVTALLARQGYTRVHARRGRTLEVVRDRVRVAPERRERIAEAVEGALEAGRGRMAVHRLGADGETIATRRFSTALHCADCDLDYREPTPSAFSFNSPLGACETCRGFGRTMGIDLGLVVPDESKTLAGGAVRPWQTKSYSNCQRDLMRYAREREVPVDVPWRELSEKHRQWVLEGEGRRRQRKWYGVRRFFDWLETKAYRMHIRVLLSKYRSYAPCPDCEGARLKPDALLWRVGGVEQAAHVVAPAERFRPSGWAMSDARFAALPGLGVHDVVLLPLARALAFFEALSPPGTADEATDLLLGEIRARLRYLVEVGLGYLTLDRQSRTLSGGEVQRINLTTALGTSLVNTLFVLDEPSIGLHARDMRRIIDVLARLRDAGNSLLVVEHDPQVMMAADRVVDLGPGPGERGGEIVFSGTPAALMRSRRSLTARYLRGERRVADGAIERLAVDHRTPRLEVLGAAEHNLAGVDVAFPLGRLVCVTGVSGSGKSTLVGDVVHRGIAKLMGRAVEAAGAHRAIRGHEHVGDVVMVDQSPIGKTTRSNPASYVGALDAIRKRFADLPAAKARGYGPGTFSFNSGDGRCPACGGNGFEHVEMQFLSDVYLRCPDCGGRRYRAEVLEVRLAPAGGGDRGRSIADVLEMTVEEALAFFAGARDVERALEPLGAVGLGYLRLGQPVPTLSGGEAQRLKLAKHLAGAGAEATLFLFDEPTTGLHFDDIARLLGAFARLRAAGHSLLVIEHNLDVVDAADWIVDLGPEGGDGGGRLVAEGPPDAIAAGDGHTGAALAAHRRGTAPPPKRARAARTRGREAIRIHHAREHNLADVDIAIPRDRFTVITGISGSGKSTVAFDILFAEGQRRYLESLNAYARQFVQPAARPDVDAIFGIPPTVAIEQRTSRGGRKSTVATMTELYHFLRLLFVKLGVQHCPDCDIPIEPQSEASVVARVLRAYRGREVEVLAPLVVARKGYYTDLAKWAAGKGFEHLRVDGGPQPTAAWPRLDRYREHDIDLPVGRVRVGPRTEAALRDLVARAIALGGGLIRVSPADDTGETLYSTRRACPGCGRSFDELDPRLFSFNSRHGWCPACFGTGAELEDFDEEQTGEERWWTEWFEGEAPTCGACAGRRLRPEALAVRWRDLDVAEATAMSVEAAGRWFARLKPKGREAEIARDALAEIRGRLGFLAQVGLGYLRLDRAAPTLSGGEAQRIRLAAQLGSNLRGVCYILDEPTIGLHPRDNRMLLDTLRGLEAKGNTVVVVEHDEDTIRAAEHLVDLGPGAGVNGGRVVAQGSLAKLMRARESVTGRYLARPLAHPIPDVAEIRRARDAGEPIAPLEIEGARLHNLRGIDVALPLGRLVCVTGVSGSGKSSLVRGVVRDNVAAVAGARRRGAPRWLGCDAIRGHEAVDRVLEVDQTPIGKTPRSCPATYVGIWDAVRRLFAETPEARMRGYKPGRFSFNTSGGRCETCDGQGTRRIEMSFLPDVRVRCEACAGARFDPETLAVHWRDRSVAEVLAMSVDEAVAFFAAHTAVHHALRLLQEVGLGYLTLGQPSPTLSGGEAQRIKLVTELAKARPPEAVDSSGRRRARRGPHTLYVLDEPTIGLHMADVEKLVRVLHRLVAAGNSVLVIEHNLDVVAEADWVVDLGPEGGDGGGRVIAQGPPETIATRKRSHTAAALRPFLAARTAGRDRTPRASGARARR